MLQNGTIRHCGEFFQIFKAKRCSLDDVYRYRMSMELNNGKNRSSTLMLS